MSADSFACSAMSPRLITGFLMFACPIKTFCLAECVHFTQIGIKAEYRSTHRDAYQSALMTPVFSPPIPCPDLVNTNP
jgi:hypothetical protein